MDGIELIWKSIPPGARQVLVLLVAGGLAIGGWEAFKSTARAEAAAEVPGEVRKVVTSELQEQMTRSATTAAIAAAREAVAPVAAELAEHIGKDDQRHLDLSARVAACCPYVQTDALPVARRRRALSPLE